MLSRGGSVAQGASKNKATVLYPFRTARKNNFLAVSRACPDGKSGLGPVKA